MTNEAQTPKERIMAAVEQAPEPMKNAAQVVGGAAVAAVGVPLLVLPGPGLVTIAAGAAIAGNGAYKLLKNKADSEDTIEVEPVEVTAVDPDAVEAAPEPAAEAVAEEATAAEEPAADEAVEAAAAEQEEAEAPAEDEEAADEAEDAVEDDELADEIEDLDEEELEDEPTSKVDEAKAAFAKAGAEAEAAAKRFVDFANSDLIPAGKAAAAGVAQKAPELAQASVAEAKRAAAIGKDVIEQGREALRQDDKRAALGEFGQNTVKPIARDVADAAVACGKAAADGITQAAIAGKDLAVKGAYAVMGKEQPVAEEPAAEQAEPVEAACQAEDAVAEEPIVEVVPDEVTAPIQPEVPEPVAVQDAEAEEVVEAAEPTEVAEAAEAPAPAAAEEAIEE